MKNQNKAQYKIIEYSWLNNSFTKAIFVIHFIYDGNKRNEDWKKNTIYKIFEKKNEREILFGILNWWWENTRNGKRPDLPCQVARIIKIAKKKKM